MSKTWDQHKAECLSEIKRAGAMEADTIRAVLRVCHLAYIRGVHDEGDAVTAAVHDHLYPPKGSTDEH